MANGLLGNLGIEKGVCRWGWCLCVCVCVCVFYCCVMGLAVYVVFRLLTRLLLGIVAAANVII